MSDISGGASAPDSPANAEVDALPDEIDSGEQSLGGTDNQATAQNDAPQGDAKKAIAQAEKAMLKKFKLKVDGKEEEMELDLANEAELVKQLQLAKAAQKRMQEAAEAKKSKEGLETDLKEFFRLLREDPKGVLSDPAIGIDIKQLALQMIEQEEAERAKSPEQREKELLQQQLEKLQKEKQELEEGRKKEEFQRLQQQAAIEVENDIIQAIEKSDIPKSPYAIKKMADAMLIAMQNGIDVGAKDVVPIVRKQMLDDLRSMAGILPEEILEDILGKDKIASLRKRYIQQIRKPPATSSNIQQTASQPKADRPQEKMSARDFFRKLGE